MQSNADASNLLELIRALRIVPVLVVDDARHAVPLARALSEGGLPCAEITFRTGAALETIRRISTECPDMLVGAGTVLTREQAREARSAGARFIVSPGFGPAVVDDCLEHGTPVFPGVCTPTEIEMALNKGLRVVKFFPAEPIGGLAYLKAIAAPFAALSFIPTGGISPGNLVSYLGFKNVLACGGSWMAPADWIAASQFDRIRSETARACSIARGDIAATGGNVSVSEMVS